MSLHSRLPQKPSLRQRIANMNLRKRVTGILSWILGITLVVLLIAGCAIVTNGWWQALGQTIQQVVLAVVGVGALYYCIGFVLFIVIVAIFIRYSL